MPGGLIASRRAPHISVEHFGEVVPAFPKHVDPIASRPPLNAASPHLERAKQFVARAYLNVERVAAFQFSELDGIRQQSRDPRLRDFAFPCHGRIQCIAEPGTVGAAGSFHHFG